MTLRVESIDRALARSQRNLAPSLSPSSKPSARTLKAPDSFAWGGSDVVLPGQSGPETATHLRNARPDLRVLLMSGYTDRLLDGHRDVDARAPFLAKPFTMDQLLRKVREVLDRREPNP